MCSSEASAGIACFPQPRPKPGQHHAAPVLGLVVFHCPYCPEYFALDIHQIEHHLRINHDAQTMATGI
ncbi:hypothetical protein LPJ75_001864 [Coemansia sp. RSA 2598]|nr:hypothetical protein LPJ75_001864 [Coemansia sp. RSA 2598]